MCLLGGKHTNWGSWRKFKVGDLGDLMLGTNASYAHGRKKYLGNISFYKANM